MNFKEKIQSKIKILEAVRKKQNKTIPEMAKEVGTTTQSYCNWIKGKYRPSLESYHKIKDYLEE